MRCAGVAHGDLSEHNVLIDSTGPVVIDLPQAIDAAGNTEAGIMLERDMANLASCLGRFAPELTDTRYGKEIWALYRSGLLRHGMVLTGQIALGTRLADVGAVLREIDIARQEAEEQEWCLQQS